MASVVLFIQHILVAVERFLVELIKNSKKSSTSELVKEQRIEREDPLYSFFTKLLRSDTLHDFFVVVKIVDSSLLQPTGRGLNSTPHTSHFLGNSHLMTRTRVAQVVSLACAHHIPCVILMRSCCVFDSLRLLHFPLFAVHLLSYHPVFPPGHQLHLPRCGGQIPCALSLMRTLALLPSTTLSHRNARTRQQVSKLTIVCWRRQLLAVRRSS